MLYCLICIDSINPTSPVLKRQNTEINISSNDNFVCSHCKTNVKCNLTNNRIKTKGGNEEFVKEDNDDPLGNIHSICFILNLLNYNPSFLQYLL